MSPEAQALITEAVQKGSFDPSVLYTMLAFIGVFFLANLAALFRVIWFFAKLDSRVIKNKEDVDEAHKKIRRIEFKLGGFNNEL